MEILETHDHDSIWETREERILLNAHYLFYPLTRLISCTQMWYLRDPGLVEGRHLLVECVERNPVFQDKRIWIEKQEARKNILQAKICYRILDSERVHCCILTSIFEASGLWNIKFLPSSQSSVMRPSEIAMGITLRAWEENTSNVVICMWFETPFELATW